MDAVAVFDQIAVFGDFEYSPAVQNDLPYFELSRPDPSCCSHAAQDKKPQVKTRQTALRGVIHCAPRRLAPGTAAHGEGEGVTELELPDDLLLAQRDYYAADVEVQEITNRLPSSLDIVTGEAEIADEQRTELAAARAKRLDLVDAINRHPWWETVEDRNAARIELQKAARG